MDKNIIFCFSGTGNSLKVSKDISQNLNNCTVENMQKKNCKIDIGVYTQVGFIFPVYFIGLPAQVRDFMMNLKIPTSFKGYFYAVATYANYAGDTLKQADQILEQKGFHLNYANQIKMGDNAITLYKPHINIEKMEQIYNIKMPEIIEDIISKREKKAQCAIKPFQIYHNIQLLRVYKHDRGFQISKNCTQCGLCKEVCPGNNITGGKNEKPEFLHQCQRCMACIQLCPQKAIDYRNKCADRPRYKHPDIAVNEIRKLNSLEM